ncbi:MAG: STAS/SEC14 domain-containing protein [Clostridia bacterium]|nr:STAS/SEC14 domain-containing protein [Clostridia bacterium]
MGKVNLTTKNGKSIIALDFSGSSGANEVIAVINEFKAYNPALKPALTLANVQNMDFSSDIIQIFKAFADNNKREIKALAVVGLSGVKKVLFKTATLSLGVPTEAFSESEMNEALHWLTKY